MKKNRFILAEATLDEVNKQLRLNVFIIIVVLFVLGSNIMHFMRDKSPFYAGLTVVMIIALFFVMKSRHVLNLKKQSLSN